MLQIANIFQSKGDLFKMHAFQKKYPVSYVKKESINFPS